MLWVLNLSDGGHSLLEIAERAGMRLRDGPAGGAGLALARAVGEARHMKVVLFCGGQGMRLRGVYDDIPKPLVEIGGRPILWHIMRYYAHHGHADFILCLGHKGDSIEAYFRRKPPESDGWRITFADTGVDSSIGERLGAAKRYLDGESSFWPTTPTASPTSRSPSSSIRCKRQGRDHALRQALADVPFREDPARRHGHRDRRGTRGGPARERRLLRLPREIFDASARGRGSRRRAFQPAGATRALQARLYDGFWKNMDTFKDKQALDELCASGRAPWEVWRESGER